MSESDNKPEEKDDRLYTCPACDQKQARHVAAHGGYRSIGPGGCATEWCEVDVYHCQNCNHEWSE